MTVLGIINDLLTQIDVNYEYGQWSAKPIYPYFVGSCYDLPVTTENGEKDSFVILTGFNRDNYMPLETVRAMIETLFDPINGYRCVTDAGSAAIFYDHFVYIPLDEQNLKKIEIYLNVKEWRSY